MIHRFIGTSARLVHQMASQPVTLQSVIKTARGILTTAQHTLTVFGFSAVAMLALLYNRPDLVQRLTAFVNPQHHDTAILASRQTVNNLMAAPANDAVEIANSD
ncbi:MAG: hypothetical protein JF619_30195, partial [Massilia sp.]|nr:hypothetical protein [Massilia sp.]